MDKKELSMETRLLIAFVLMGLVLFLTPYFYKPVPAPAAKPAATAPKPGPVSPAATEKPPSPVPAAASAEMPGQIHADKAETVSVETDLYRVEFSNQGAVVRSWTLKAYKDSLGKPLELVNQLALTGLPAPFSVVFKGQAPANDPNSAFFQAERSPDGLKVSFEYSDGRTDTKKAFQFTRKSYLVSVTSQVTQNGVMLPHALAWRGGFGDPTLKNQATVQHALYYDLDASKLQTKLPKDAKNGPVASAGRYSFAGLEDSFFAGVFLPPSDRAAVELTAYSDAVNGEPRIGASVGGEGLNSFAFFAGPKDTDLLRQVDPKLEQLVDWGWFGFLAKPMFLLLNWTADHLVHNYGWAIVLVTVGISIVLFPLRLSSMKSSKKMQILQPQIAAINDKYKGLKINDPKKADQNQEVMDLYKKHGVNPAAGCVPMLIQFPFLFAFYKVLSVTIELRGAHWLWIPDLTQPETIAIRILPLLLIVTQFLSQKMTPSPGMDPSQQKMMMVMPAVLGYMFWFLSSGLVLYYLTSNLVGIAQQWILNRSTKSPAIAAAKPAPKKKSRN